MENEAVVEVVVFRCKAGTAAEARRLCKSAVDEARTHGGLLSDVLLQSADDPHLFVHEVRWRSLEDAKRVAALFPTFACAAAFQAIMAELVLMTHAHVVPTG